MRRTLLALALVTTAAFGLLQAQTAVVSPNQPKRGVMPRSQDRAPSVPAMSSVDPALFRGMKYRLVGPSRGGRRTTGTRVGSQPNTFSIGVATRRGVPSENG